MSTLTRKAKGQDCIKCHGPDAYACHYNGPRQLVFGKGRSIKCHDLMTAEFCSRCDAEFTEGSTDPRWKDKWDRSEEFMYWISLTNIRRYNNEIIGVK